MVRTAVTTRTTRPGAPGESIPAMRSGTRTLLACGLAAGPLYITAALAQGLARDGFDLTRHDVSLLANGSLGWIQVANFLITGLLTVACAAGLRRVLPRGERGGRAPLLLAGYGVGLIAAGVFRADPADGFPAGTPAGWPDTVSWHGMLHGAAAGAGFLCLVAACLVLARRYSALGQRGLAAYSRLTGVAFLAGFVGVASGSGSRAVVLAFWVAVVVAWVWVAAAALVAARAAASAPSTPDGV